MSGEHAKAMVGEEAVVWLPPASLHADFALGCKREVGVCHVCHGLLIQLSHGFIGGFDIVGIVVTAAGRHVG